MFQDTHLSPYVHWVIGYKWVDGLLLAGNTSLEVHLRHQWLQNRKAWSTSLILGWFLWRFVAQILLTDQCRKYHRWSHLLRLYQNGRDEAICRCYNTGDLSQLEIRSPGYLPILGLQTRPNLEGSSGCVWTFSNHSWVALILLMGGS